MKKWYKVILINRAKGKEAGISPLTSDDKKNLHV